MAGLRYAAAFASLRFNSMSEVVPVNCHAWPAYWPVGQYAQQSACIVRLWPGVHV
jgi:hypothetical protein